MREPIIVTDRDGHTTVYGSAADAERDVESVDVEADEYTVYDADGRVLEFAIEGELEKPRRLAFGLTSVAPLPVKLVERTGERKRTDELLALLEQAAKTADSSGEPGRARELRRLAEPLKGS
jgi:hypothetical protein